MRIQKTVNWDTIKQCCIFIPLISWYIIQKGDAQNERSVVAVSYLFFMSRFLYVGGYVIGGSWGLTLLNTPGYIGSLLSNFIAFCMFAGVENSLKDYLTGERNI